MPSGGRRDSNRRFTEVEDEIIRLHYGTLSVEEIRRRLPIVRSPEAVRARARKLGVAATIRGNPNHPNAAKARKAELTSAERSAMRFRADRQKVELRFAGLEQFDPMLRRVAREKALGLEPGALVKFDNAGQVAYQYD